MKPFIASILFCAIAFAGCAIAWLLSANADSLSHYFHRTAMVEYLLAITFFSASIYCVVSAWMLARKSKQP